MSDQTEKEFDVWIASQLPAGRALPVHIYFSLDERRMAKNGFEAGKELQAARIKELEKDAARYRFISVGFTPMGLSMNGMHPWICRISPSRLKGPNLDAAIDLAMSQEDVSK